MNIDIDKLKRQICYSISDVSNWPCGFGHNSDRFTIGEKNGCQIQVVVTDNENEFLPEHDELMCLKFE